MVIAALAAAIAIFLTTPRGAALARRLGFGFGPKDGAPEEDRAYLLRVCGGDPRVVEQKLAAARVHNPEMSEKDAYRRAIRTHLRDKA